MNVLVTGATTALGAAIVDHLLRSRDVSLVMAVGREREGAHHASDRILYRNVDLTHARSIHELVWGDARVHGIEAIVHVMQHRSAVDAGPGVHAQNVNAVRELLRACADHPTIRRFVYRSFADVYEQPNGTADLVDEEAPLDFRPTAPQWIRDRVEADLCVCAHLGGPLEVAVLRCAEIVARGIGSSLWDYLSRPVCLHPLGFDPMLNVLSLEDAAVAFGAALQSPEIGIFNIRGLDTLPLSRAIAESVKLGVAVPGPLLARLAPLRFRTGTVLDGRKAHARLGFVPATPVRWPRPWWRRLIDEVTTFRAEGAAPHD